MAYTKNQIEEHNKKMLRQCKEMQQNTSYETSYGIKEKVSELIDYIL